MRYYVILLWLTIVAEKKILLLDLLAIHMVRDIKGSTIISFHHTIDGSTTAEDLFTRLKLVGRSVYWYVQKLLNLQISVERLPLFQAEDREEIEGPNICFLGYFMECTLCLG
jgi:hypothetical protein